MRKGGTTNLNIIVAFQKLKYIVYIGVTVKKINAVNLSLISSTIPFKPLLYI